VLPDRYGPTRATQRGALGIDSSTNPVRAAGAWRPSRWTGSWRGLREVAIGIWKAGRTAPEARPQLLCAKRKHNKAVVPDKAGIHFSVSRARIGGSLPSPGRRTLNHSRARQARSVGAQAARRSSVEGA